MESTSGELLFTRSSWLNDTYSIKIKQESIPEGCIPTATVAPLGGGTLPHGYTLPLCILYPLPRYILPPGYTLPPGISLPWYTTLPHPWVYSSGKDLVLGIPYLTERTWYQRYPTPRLIPPHPGQNDRHLGKHYLPATLLAVGNKTGNHRLPKNCNAMKEIASILTQILRLSIPGLGLLTMETNRHQLRTDNCVNSRGPHANTSALLSPLSLTPAPASCHTEQTY